MNDKTSIWNLGCAFTSVTLRETESYQTLMTLQSFLGLSVISTDYDQAFEVSVYLLLQLKTSHPTVRIFFFSPNKTASRRFLDLADLISEGGVFYSPKKFVCELMDAHDDDIDSLVVGFAEQFTLCSKTFKEVGALISRFNYRSTLKLLLIEKFDEYTLCPDDIQPFQGSICSIFVNSADSKLSASVCPPLANGLTGDFSFAVSRELQFHSQSNIYFPPFELLTESDLKSIVKIKKLLNKKWT